MKENNKIISEITFHKKGDDDKDIIVYDSLLNYTKKQFWYRHSCYGINGVRINPKSKTGIVTNSCTEFIRNKIDNLISQLIEINVNNIYDESSFIEITYFDGSNRYFLNNINIEKIFEDIKLDDDCSKEPNIVLPPYLKYDTSKAAFIAELYINLNKHLKNKNIDALFQYITKDCLVEFEGKNLYGIDSIKKEIKKRSGFFNRKLKKTNFYPFLTGYLNSNNESQLKLDLTVYYERLRNYTIEIETNENYQINHIKIMNYVSKRNSKTICEQEDLKAIIAKKYNDFDKETY